MSGYNRKILIIALPAIVTNITVPLLGLVDTAIVGHMGDAAYIGAIAVGSMIFNLVYWVFGFLRMGTSGLTAQARGRRDFDEVRRLLLGSAGMSMAIALSILLLQWPLRELMLWFIGPTPDIRPLAATYYNIVVWGAPAMLGLYGLTGWYIGMQNTRIPLFVSIFQNVVNILASLTLVYGLGMKVEGVALGTVIAQYAGYAAAGVLLWRYYRRLFGGGWKVESGRLKVKGGRWKVEGGRRIVEGLKHFSLHLSPSTLHQLQVSCDIFFRTLFLVAVNLYFTSAGARQGAVILAVNTLLMQLYLLFSYFLDGFAYAGEALGGRYWGAHNDEAFRAVVHRLFWWGGAMTVLFTAVYGLGGMSFLQLLTDEGSVVDAARSYVGWAVLIPVAGVAAFIWDGIFIGITKTRGMLLSTALSSLTFFVGVITLMPVLGNHGLWLSMVLFLTMRGVVQTMLSPLTSRH